MNKFGIFKAQITLLLYMPGSILTTKGGKDKNKNHTSFTQPK